jgi:two-component system LytT family response regulator
MVRTFTDAIAGREFLQVNPVQLLFVDINMPDLNGLELVRSLNFKPMLVFTTAYKKFAADSYDLDAIDYLVKPIVEAFRFRIVTERKEDEVLLVRSDYQQVKIYWSDIEYIESVEDYLKIHLSEGRPVMTLMTLKSVLEKLPVDRFQRIHRSYIIPLGKIKSFTNRKVRLTSVELPVGDSYMGVVQGWGKIF